MGAEYIERFVLGGNEKYVKSCFEEMQDQASYENGNSYSDDINMANGIEFTGKRFKTYDEASEYMQKTAEKFGPALVCEFRNNKGQLQWLIAAVCSG